MTIDSVSGLREIYRPASGGAVDKVINELDERCHDFLSKSPFFVLSTADGDGRCDDSPKGGEPGFVELLDDGRVAWADYSGNNRLDSFENLVDNPFVALLFMIPGLDETLRINGSASLSTDPTLLEHFAVGERPAKVVVVVDVEEASCTVPRRCAEVGSGRRTPGPKRRSTQRGPHDQGPRSDRRARRGDRAGAGTRPREHALGTGRFMTQARAKKPRNCDSNAVEKSA